ncbi:hypothetical protein ABGB07_40510 [Micromonosporaceae bacterium B7E4]
MRKVRPMRPVPLVFRHRPDWRRLWLWLWCRCGRRWSSCPYRGLSILLPQTVPAPDLPPQLAAPVVPPTVDPPPPLPSMPPRGRNQHPRWTAEYPTRRTLPALVDGGRGAAGERRRGGVGARGWR